MRLSAGAELSPSSQGCGIAGYTAKGIALGVVGVLFELERITGLTLA